MKYREYSLKQFTGHDVDHYKAIRLEALQREPGVFSSNYARETAFTNAQWLDRLNNLNSACFGLYHGNTLIGVTGIVLDKQDTATAHMTQSYIRKERRGRGLSRLLYEARIAWAKQKGLKKLYIGHREDNLSSRSANQHYGFQYTHRESLQWPDGTIADSLYYELKI
ncbi:MAG: GNAT family N-acetyltransferase [Bacteroidia bacterium]